MHDKEVDEEERTLLRLAQAISDGQRIDWDAEESAHESLKSKLKRLQVLEAVRSAHGTAASADGSESPPDIPTPSTRTTISDVAPTGPGGKPAPGGSSDAGFVSWGPLDIRERLGKGGSAEVYRAFDPSLQREVALKILKTRDGRRDPFAARLLDEARRLARVRHPNVLVVHGADEHGGRAGIWTDLVHGRTLEQSLSDQGLLGAPEACVIGIHLCGALAAVHAAGLVHRDVKTSNVMREKGGRIVLMDFGSVSEQVRANGSMVPDVVSGTPLFMAPEQLAGGAPTTAADIYSLGVVLYRLVTGRFPVEAAHLAELRAKHVKGERVPLRDHRPDLTPGFVQVVERALAAEPGNRYASAGAMEQALNNALGVVTPQPVVPVPVPGPVDHRRRVIAGLSIAASLIVAGALLSYSLLRSGPFKADAVLFRIQDGREERLAPGSVVHPGDHLVMEISAPETFYAYILNEDENGEVYVLFPAGLDLKNPLPAGARHRLPGRQGGKQVTWEITSVGGTENLLVIASRGRQAEVEVELSNLPRAEPGRQIVYAPLSRRSVAVLRGIGGLAEQETPAGTHGDVLSSIAQSLTSRSSGRGDFWIWHLQLQNNAPPQGGAGR
ncbi:MAG TPA: serine/threonine-protein kinase [Candidatus Cryosericum sp.]|nr:serine/threonine-protein kinase [Candidatus Cryosericum sp.]